MSFSGRNLLPAAIALMALFCAPGVVSRTLDNRSRVVSDVRTHEKRMLAPASSDGETKILYYPMILRFTDLEKGMEELRDLGAVIYYTREDMALACVPRDKIEVIDRGQFVDRASISATTVRATDRSRAVTGVNVVHRGDADGGIPGYDGTGIVTGLCDMGFDPSHIAFEGRVGMMSIYVDSLAVREVYAPGTSLDTGISLPETDNADETHATHVANIMAGGVKGNPYYGGAPGSTIAMSASLLSDMALLCGIEDIIAFAREKDMPAVVNLSVGSPFGPRDGTDLVNRYLSLLGEEALICFSAGNTGHRDISLRHDFGYVPDGYDTVGSMFESLVTWSGHNVFGGIDFWSDDARGMEIQFVAYDLREKRFVYESPWIGSMDGNESGLWRLDAESDSEWGAIFGDSYILLSYGADPDNNRFNTFIEYSVDAEDDLTPGGPHWARYVAGWRLRAEAGSGVQANSDGIYSYIRGYGVPGMISGDSKQSVSNLCSNGRSMCVGSWNSRNTVPVWGSDEHVFPYEINRSTNFSSYGVLYDGTVLPHVCAPGNTLVSAMSAPYFAAHPEATIADAIETGGVVYRWYEECGTSMASPMAAATFALWMQAYPELTITDAIATAQATARRDFGDISDPHWGAGALDAAAGLKMVREMSGISNITPDIADPDSATYYTLQGLRISGKPTEPGIYIRQCGTKTDKIIVRQ